jgi:hypothetical protein
VRWGAGVAFGWRTGKPSVGAVRSALDRSRISISDIAVGHRWYDIALWAALSGSAPADAGRAALDRLDLIADSLDWSQLDRLELHVYRPDAPTPADELTPAAPREGRQQRGETRILVDVGVNATRDTNFRLAVTRAVGGLHSTGLREMRFEAVGPSPRTAQRDRRDELSYRSSAYRVPSGLRAAADDAIQRHKALVEAVALPSPDWLSLAAFGSRVVTARSITDADLASDRWHVFGGELAKIRDSPEGRQRLRVDGRVCIWCDYIFFGRRALSSRPAGSRRRAREPGDQPLPVEIELGSRRAWVEAVLADLLQRHCPVWSDVPDPLKQIEQRRSVGGP